MSERWESGDVTLYLGEPSIAVPQVLRGACRAPFLYNFHRSEPAFPPENPRHTVGMFWCVGETMRRAYTCIHAPRFLVSLEQRGYTTSLSRIGHRSKEIPSHDAYDYAPPWILPQGFRGGYLFRHHYGGAQVLHGAADAPVGAPLSRDAHIAPGVRPKPSMTEQYSHAKQICRLETGGCPCRYGDVCSCFTSRENVTQFIGGVK